MTKIDRDQTPADLVWVAERLEQERPTASPLELDRMKVQARAQAVRGARSQAKGSVLKSRVAIAAILMLGLLTGGTGTTLALNGGSGNASQVQYPPPDGQVLGKKEGDGNGPSGQVLGTSQSNPDAVQGSQDAVRGSQQVGATQDQAQGDLPFTGLAAVPLIVLGLALVGGGTMLYRSARQQASAA
ncbi:MAG: hypothetical protein M3131_09165 [Actinomycetota bacterium]|nr:hypothetical protein [Actinomycetota bacterium]